MLSLINFMCVQNAPLDKFNIADISILCAHFFLTMTITAVSIGMLYQQFRIVWDMDFRKLNIVADLYQLLNWSFVVTYPLALTDNTAPWYEQLASSHDDRLE